MSLTFGPFQLVPGKRLLLRSNQPVRLPSNAYEILLLLVERSGQLILKSELIERVSARVVIGESQLRVYISKLRKVLEEGSKGLRYVENVNGHGYRFIVPVTRSPIADLLIRRASEGASNFELTDADVAAIVGIFGALGDLPLAARMIAGASFEFGPFELIPDRRLLLQAGRSVNVPSRAWELLLALIERAGELVGKADLLTRVWPHVVVEEGALRVHISGLRRILGDRPDGTRYIDSITGRGYRFVAAVRRHDAMSSIASTPGSKIAGEKSQALVGPARRANTTPARASTNPTSCSHERVS